MSQPSSHIGSPVIVSYQSVKDPNADLSREIEEAFGFAGLGLIIVKGTPEYPELRCNLLPLASDFVKLPDSVKAKYVHEKSYYCIGWSHGKEKLKQGVPDIYKGSYYNNPQYDVPTTDPAMIAASPEMCCPNIWPQEDLPALEPAFKALGQLMVNVGIELAHHCDKYVIAKLGTDKFLEENRLQNIIRSTKTTKARLLHYFEVPDATTISTDTDNWCGWHNDHGSLTALCSAMYHDIRTGTTVQCPDPEAGLYARTRTGGVQLVHIPSDCLAFQIGESSQITSGGILRATPHAVRALNPPGSTFITRDTFVVFMQPNLDHVMNPPKGVPVSEVEVGQFKEGMDFGAFGKATIEYYSV